MLDMWNDIIKKNINKIIKVKNLPKFNKNKDTYSGFAFVEPQYLYVLEPKANGFFKFKEKKEKENEIKLIPISTSEYEESITLLSSKFKNESIVDIYNIQITELTYKETPVINSLVMDYIKSANYIFGIGPFGMLALYLSENPDAVNYIKPTETLNQANRNDCVADNVSISSRDKIKLPNEIVSKIISYLDPVSIVNLLTMQTKSDWVDLIAEEYFVDNSEI